MFLHKNGTVQHWLGANHNIMTQTHVPRTTWLSSSMLWSHPFTVYTLSSAIMSIIH